MFPKSDRAIRILLLFLLLFAPLAFGSVEAWSRTILIVTANAITLTWIARELIYPDESRQYRRRHSHMGDPFAGLLVPAIAVVAVIALQLVPLGEAITSFLSPGTAEVYRRSGLEPEHWTLSTWPDQSLLTAAIILSLTGLFFALLNTNLGRRNLSFLLAAITATGFALAVIAILHKLSGSDLLLWVRPLSRGGSPFGPYVNKNHFAGLMTLLVPLGIGYAFFIAPRTIYEQQTRRTQRTLLGFMLLVMAGALFFSLSRGGMLGLLLSLLLLAAYIPRIAGKKRHQRLAVIALTAIAAALVFSFWIAGDTLLDRLETFLHLEEDLSLATRLDIWGDTLEMIRDFPLLGAGLGTYVEAFEPYQTGHMQLRFREAHNEYLQLAAEFGLLGTAALAALFLAAFGQSLAMIKKRKSNKIIALTAGGLCGLFAFLIHCAGEFHFRIPANAFYFTVTSALTLSAAFQRRAGEPQPPDSHLSDNMKKS